MKTTASIALIFVSLNCISMVSAGKNPFPSPESIPFKPITFQIIKPEIINLENRSEIWHMKDLSVPMITVLLDMPCGSNSDPENLRGVSNMTAQSILRGGTKTRTPEQIDAFLESNAIVLRAFSYSTFTQIELSCMSDDFSKAVDLLFEIISDPVFDPSQIEISRQIMIGWIKRYKERPFYEAGENMYRILYGKNHPVAMFSDETIIARITRDDLVNFFQQNYKADRTKLAIIGNYSEKNLDYLKNLMSNWGKGPAFEVALPPPEPLYKENHILIVDKPGTQTAFSVGHLGIEPNSPDRYALDVFNDIYGQGSMSSRLMNIIRTQMGFAYMVYGGFEWNLPVGLFTSECQTKTSNTIQAIQEIQKIIEDMRANPVGQAELEQARESLQNSFVFHFERPRSLVQRLLFFERNKMPKTFMDTYLEKIRSITEADIMQAAEKHIHPEQMQIVAVGPAEELKPQLEKLGWPIDIIPSSVISEANNREHKTQEDR